MQVVGEMAGVNFMDGDDAHGGIVEVGQPFLLLARRPVILHRGHVVEGLRRPALQGTGAVHRGKGVTHVSRGLNHLAAVLRGQADNVEVNEGLADIFQHFPGLGDQS